MCTDAIKLSPNDSNVAINVLIGQWNFTRVHERGTYVPAVKDKPYERVEEGVIEVMR